MDDSIAISHSTSGVAAPEHAPPRWLLLTHHIPPEPAYFRVKVRRRLERLGSVALKNSVYVLPHTDETLEDFQWLLQEIRLEGGEATLCEATFVDDLTDERLIAGFREAREADYEEVVRSARAAIEDAEGDASGGRGPGLAVRAERLARRLEQVKEVDFFQASGRAAAERSVQDVRDRMVPGEASPTPSVASATEGGVGRGRTWVTRVGVREDRISSGWLIRRFIDPDARFRFVEPRGYRPGEGELRFDMFEGEYTHVREACTFETLRAAFGLSDPALEALGEIIHDLDCKDDKFGRPETAGVASLIHGIVRRYAGDAERLERGAAVLDDLYEHFRASSG